MTHEDRNRMEVVGDFALTWGESLRWDDRLQRLYFVDTATDALHWLDGGEPPLHSMTLPGKPTGVVLTQGETLVICLDDGLHIVDPGSGRTELLAPYPAGMHGRANDANADHTGNLVTGTLNLAPGPGAVWRFSADFGWTMLEDGWGNANGPVFVGSAEDPTLVLADTLAQEVLSFSYDPTTGRVGRRRVLAEYAGLGGLPDGAAVDSQGGIWSCVVLGSTVVRLTEQGIDRTVELPVVNPSDVAFGGPDLDRLYVVSIAVDLGAGTGRHAGRLLAGDVGVRGRPERRFCAP